MQHFSKSSWDENCTQLETFGHTVIPIFSNILYTHIIWLARWIFRASLQIACTTGCTLHSAHHNRLSRTISRWVSIVLLVLWKTKRAIFLALHTAKTCESPIPDRNHTARCNWKKASAFHGEWDTAGWKLAEDALYLCSFIGCCKLTIRLNYFQQSSKHASLALTRRNLLQDQRTERQTTSKHGCKEAQNHRLAGIKSWPASQEYNELAESVWHWNWSTPFSPCY